MFTKLLNISNVANSNWGLSSSRMMRFSLELSLSRQRLRSSEEREKNATSEPDTSAESNNKMIKINKLGK